MSRSFELPEAEWATVGTVGEPGQRTFYLQARQDSQLVTLKLEKQQVAALTQFLAEILADLPAPEPTSTTADLVAPVLAEWAVGTLHLAFDHSTDRVVILAQEVSLTDDQDDDAGDRPDDAELDPLFRGAGPDDPDLGAARIAITRESAALLVGVGSELVASGRPTCPLCGRPMDPEGHTCPRTNGHKPH